MSSGEINVDKIAVNNIKSGDIDITATGNDINKLTSVVSTSQKLNILSGVTVSKDEINLLKGSLPILFAQIKQLWWIQKH